MNDNISTGIQYLDKITGGYRLGDNVVWQISDGIPIDNFIKAFFRKQNNFNKNIIYISFNYSPQTICKKYQELFENNKVILLDAFTNGKGSGDALFREFYDKEKAFSNADFIIVNNPKEVPVFIDHLRKIEEKNRDGSFYIFDSLTGMSELWKDESRVLDLFTYTCPKLYDLNTLAYWIYEKNAHSKEFMAGVSHTTQIIFSLQNISGGFINFKIQKLEGRSGFHAKSPHQFEFDNDDILFHERKDDFLRIGEKIKDLRKKNNKTQTELADLIGLTPGAVSQIENSVISPSLNTLLQIASIFGKPPEYFIEDISKKTVNKNYSLYKKNKLNEYSNENAAVCGLIDNENQELKIYSISLNGNSELKGPVILHKGREILVVTEGSVQITVNNENFQLKKNETLEIRNSFIEKIVNRSSKVCELIYILV